MWKPLSALLALVLLIVVAIGPVSGDSPWCGGQHKPCPTTPPTPSDTDMAIVSMAGLETQAALTEGVGLNDAGSTISNAQARTGSYSLRLNAASGASASANVPAGINYMNFGLYIATMPSVTRQIAGATAAAGVQNLALNSDGTLAVRNNTTVVGTSTTALLTDRWYWIGYRNIGDGANTAQLQINGTTEVTGTGGSSAGGTIGAIGTEASAIDIYVDDYITDSAAFVAPSRVNLAKPISDVSRTDWTNDAAGTTLFSANNSTPPTGIADTTSGSGLHQTRDATNGTDTYVVNMTTYTTLGILSTDKVLATLAFAATGAPSATSPKAGSLTVSNPTMNKESFGNFYQGSSTAGTFPSGWAYRSITIATTPTVTLGTSPTITVTQDTSSTRIAMVCFLGLYVAWTPGALGSINTTLQAVPRAANY